MSRPKPTILNERIDPKTHKADQVLAAEGVYAVFCDGQPINLRRLSTLVDYPGPKYFRVAFMNPGHAFNLAERLNILFRTKPFAVYRLTGGEPVSE